MQNLANSHPAFFALGFPVYFIALWCVVGFLISSIGGWRKLGKDYATMRTFPENTMHMRSGKMRLTAHYNNVLTLGSDTEGLYFGVLFLFRIGHPRLFIPWQDITVEPAKKQFFWSTQTLRLGSEAIPLTLRASLATQLLSSRT